MTSRELGTNYASRRHSATTLSLALLLAATAPGVIAQDSAAVGFNHARPQKLTAGADANPTDGFGHALAISGETAIVGAEGPEAAYVFVRRGGAWSLQQKLTVQNGDVFFGFAVAISGDVAVVGAHNENNSSGAVYVFTRQGRNTWTQRQRLAPSDGVPGAYFGLSIAITGDTILVCAPGSNLPPNNFAPGVYAFDRGHNGQWTERQKLSVPNTSPFSNSVVRASGDTALVSSYLEDNNTGAAYVFVRRDGMWTLQQRLSPSDGVPGSLFGFSLSVSGDTILISAPGGDFPPNSFSPEAYSFERIHGTWLQVKEVPLPAAGPNLPYPVAVKDDTAIIGVPGAAYVYLHRGGQWWQWRQLAVPGAGPTFGNSVALAEGTALVGAPTPTVSSSPGGGCCGGAVYAFAGVGEF